MRKLRLLLPRLQIVSRELVETAARRRTYVIRVIAALLGLGAFYVAYRAVEQSILFAARFGDYYGL